MTTDPTHEIETTTEEQRRNNRDRADANRLAEELRRDYIAVRVLPDNSVAALGDLLFTRAIFLGVTRLAWSRRFCFEDRALATRRFIDLTSEDDEPQGYVAKR